jgi:hypothetical protein|nr:MAG TPA: hypothetical protein [Caudoviricetes sp.]
MIRRMWHCGLIHYLPNNELRRLYYDCCYFGEKYLSGDFIRADSLCSPLNNQTQDDFRAYLVKVITELELRGIDYKKRDVDLSKAVGGLAVGANIAVYRDTRMFKEWHTKEYLRLNMAVLYEKWKYTNCIDDKQWEKLLRGYKKITREDYVV